MASMPPPSPTGFSALVGVWAVYTTRQVRGIRLCDDKIAPFLRTARRTRRIRQAPTGWSGPLLRCCLSTRRPVTALQDACCVFSAAKQGAERKIRTLDAAIDEDPKVEGGAFADDPGNQPRFGAGTGEADMQHIGQDAVDRLDTLPRIVEPMPQRGRQVCGGHDLGVI